MAGSSVVNSLLNSKNKFSLGEARSIKDCEQVSSIHLLTEGDSNFSHDIGPRKLSRKLAYSLDDSLILYCSDCGAHWLKAKLNNICPDCESNNLMPIKKTRKPKFKFFEGKLEIKNSKIVDAIIAHKTDQKAANVLGISLKKFAKNWKGSSNEKLMERAILNLEEVLLYCEKLKRFTTVDKYLS